MKQVVKTTGPPAIPGKLQRKASGSAPPKLHEVPGAGRGVPGGAAPGYAQKGVPKKVLHPLTDRRPNEFPSESVSRCRPSTLPVRSEFN